MQPAAPSARGLLLDIGGVVLRNARELVVGRAALDVPCRAASTSSRTDFAGPGDELWQSMLRHEITERDFWAQRARRARAGPRPRGLDDLAT